MHLTAYAFRPQKIEINTYTSMNKLTSLQAYIERLARSNPPARESGITIEQHVATYLKHQTTGRVFLDGNIVEMTAIGLRETARKNGETITGVFATPEGQRYLAEWDFEQRHFTALIQWNGDLEVPVSEDIIVYSPHAPRGEAEFDRSKRQAVPVKGYPIFLNMSGHPIRFEGDDMYATWSKFDGGKAGWVQDPD